MTDVKSAPPVEGRLCFLSSSEDPPAQALLFEVLTLLDDLDVNVMGPAAAHRLSLSSTPVDARPDVGIFIFGRDLSPTLVFEIGILVGQRRPVLLIAPSELELPLALAELPRLTGPIAGEALRFQVSTFLRSRVGRKPKSKRSRGAPSAPPRTELADPLPTPRNASAWKGLFGHPNLDDELIRSLVHAPFKTAPLYPLAQTSAGGSYADAAFWLPEVEPLNPVIVEFKINPSPSDLRQFAELLGASDLHIGIVTVSAVQQPTVSVEGGTAIVTVPRAMLNDLSPSGRLRHALVEARNRLLHGAGD